MTGMLDDSTIDEFLDSDLGTVEDIPDFVDPPSGIYYISPVSYKFETFQKRDQTTASRLRIVYKVDETVEIADGEVAIPDGSRFSETFIASQKGKEFLKKRIGKILGEPDMDGVIIREALDEMVGGEEGTYSKKVRITYRDSERDGKTYTNMRLTYLK